jgi:hypothetical protein
MDMAKKFATVGDDKFFTETYYTDLRLVYEAEERFAKIFGIAVWMQGLHECEALEQRVSDFPHHTLLF